MANKFIRGNNRIEKAVSEFLEERTQKNLINVLETIRQRMNEKGHFLIPVTIPEDTVKALKTKERIPLEELHFSVRKHSTKEGKTVFVVYTTQGELNKAEKTSMISDSIERFMQITSENADVDGILINPQGNAFFLSKENIKKIFEVDAKIKETLREGLLNASQNQ